MNILTLLRIHVYHAIVYIVVLSFASSSSVCGLHYPSLSIIHHLLSTVFYVARQFNAPLGDWDVSRVGTMYNSEYIRICDFVHHKSQFKLYPTVYGTYSIYIA